VGRSMNSKAAKNKRVCLSADLKQALSQALDYEQGKRRALRVSRLPSPRSLTNSG